MRKYFTLTTLIILSIIALNSNAQSDTCTKVNYPLPGTMKLLTYKSPTDGFFYGYVSGNSINGDKIKANIFKYDAVYKHITGAYLKFGFATNTNEPNITIALWNIGITKPGNMLASKTIPIADIVNDVANDRETFVQFDSSVEVTGSYFIGVILPSYAGDTVALMSNTNGDTKPGIAWEQWSDNNWHAYSEYGCWDIDISNAIYPLACNKKINSVGDESYDGIRDINVFPNPASENINVSFVNRDNKNVSIKIIDMLGKCMKTVNLKNTNNTIIDLKAIPQGVYYLSVGSESDVRNSMFIVRK